MAMSDAKKPKHRIIEYVPPPDAVIDKYAKDVCAAMAELKNDESFNNREIWSGLAGFMKAVARSEANRLTREANQEDTTSE